MRTCWADSSSGSRERTGSWQSSTLGSRFVPRRARRSISPSSSCSPKWSSACALPQRYVEALPDHLLLEHATRTPSLVVGLDLFEFLLRSADGLLPGPQEGRALAEDLATFRNQLLARPTREIVIVEGGQRLHRIRVAEGIIERQAAAQ